MTRLPAAGAFGNVDHGRFPSLSPGPVATGGDGAAVCATGALVTENSSLIADRTGGVMILVALRLVAGATIIGVGITNTGTLRTVRLFRFELFFFAETPICAVNMTSITDIARIEIRTGLTILILLLTTANLLIPL
jgi:hypothetical protein